MWIQKLITFYKNNVIFHIKFEFDNIRKTMN
jgi:hypothetical protein